MLKQVIFIAFFYIIRIQSQLTEVISIQQGSLQGSRNSYADEFLGIKYAGCPERFAPVTDAEPWSGIFIATTPAPGCYQNCTSFPSACPDPKNIDECCFTLNIYRPRETLSNANLPIMVHFYGGSFTDGAAGVPLLNASRLVGLTNDTIVITCNYRLQAFGFWFNLNDITAPGNVALLDQKTCLQWIQNNSAAFGGNPLNVTIWGQSAGASSVGFQLQYYVLNSNQPKLFHQVLFQSWPAGIQPRTLNQSQQYNAAFATLAGCSIPINVTQCLRSKTSDEILTASTIAKFNIFTYPDKLITVGLPWQATLELDSFYLAYNNIDFINRYASQMTIPVTWGTDKDEGTLFLYEAISRSFPISYSFAQLIISALWHPENTVAISTLYNVTVESTLLDPIIDYHSNIAQILSDYIFTCPMRNMSRALVLADNPNVYLYVFDYILKANGTLYGSSHWAPECYTRVCHKSEMPFVFNPFGVPTIQFTDTEETFAQMIGNYWTNFGKTGNPNTPLSGSPSWDVFTTTTNGSLHLTLPTSATWNNYRGNPFCDFWDCLGYIF